MSDEQITRDQIKHLTDFSVGILDDRDPMMILEYEATSADGAAGAQQQLITMTSDQARQLAQGLLKAVNFPG